MGFDNWRKAVDATDIKIPLLIENTAGGDNAMARHLDRIAGVWDAISAAEGADEVGFCLDTCHAWAGGIELGDAVEKIRAITGRIDLVHANDSRDTFGSGADRHTNFGQGHLPADEFAGVVREAGAPVICETPGGATRAPGRLRLAPRAPLTPQPERVELRGSSGVAGRRRARRRCRSRCRGSPRDPAPGADCQSTSRPRMRHDAPEVDEATATTAR